MIGNPDWFKRRKYSGWGLTPKNYKGWFYIAGFIFPLLLFHIIPIWDTLTRVIVTGVWALILLVDTIDIMRKINKDEREKIHEAIAERNAVWTMTIILSIALVYQIIISGLNQSFYVDWWIVTALVLGLLTKAISNIYLDKNN